MENSPTLLREPQAPPFPASPRSVDLSPLEFIFALLAVITIPALVYAFFFSIKCPPWRAGRRRNDADDDDDRISIADDLTNNNTAKNSIDSAEVVSGVKYEKEAHVKEIGIECPVCLSVFADGEDIKQLSVCKHSFHAPCIDMWFISHSNCPICRASIPLKRPPPPPSTNVSTATPPPPSSRAIHDDHHQGLPDASSLV